MIIEIGRSQSTFKFNYSKDGHSFSHTLKFPDYIAPSDDSLLAIALFSRPENDETYEVRNIAASERQIEALQISTKANIKSQKSTQDQRDKLASNTFITAFSGGFDSLALKSLLPKKCFSVSVSFGGLFQREHDFFSKYTDAIIYWDIRQQHYKDKKFNESLDWRFLISPIISLGNPISPVIIRAGTIMEASPYWLNSRNNEVFNKYSTEVFGITAYHSCPISCLSEYATTKICAESYSNEEISSSLISLAAATSFKLHRKQTLLKIARNLQPESKNSYTPNYHFGASISDDMVALYINWKMGSAWTKNNYAEIPSSLTTLDMSFFEKINTGNLNRIDVESRGVINASLNKFNLKHFNEVDFFNLENAKLKYLQFKTSA